MKLQSYEPKPGWHVILPKFWLQTQCDLAQLRQVIADADLMVERVGEGVFDVSGIGELPQWAQGFVAHDQ